MGIAEHLEKLANLEEEARLGGGKEAIEKQHAKGKLTAHERLDILFDKGTFVELSMFAQHQCHDFGMEKYRPLGDGVITGYGKVDGRTVYAYAQDFTVIGGAGGHTHAEKIRDTLILAEKAKVPFIGLVDSVGGRVQEGLGTFAKVMHQNIMASGTIPQISAVMGPCAGGGVYIPALTDFILMVKWTSQMFITGPPTIKEVTGEEISVEDLGGWKAQSQISGVCDFVAENDEQCIQMIKKLLSFLPSNYLEKPPVVDTGDDPNRSDESLAEIVPDSPRSPFNMREIILRIVDNGDFFEVKAGFARNIITGFARLGGYSVGIVANQPSVASGALDCDTSDKAGRFYRTCDCFNVPIICLVDVPGYMPGVKEEYKGIIRHGAKMLYGYTEATVPKVSVIIRKAYGGSYSAIGSKVQGADIAFAWPTAEIAVMGAEGAVRVLYRKEIEEAENGEKVRQQKIEEFREVFGSPYYAASTRLIDAVIRPQETRPYLIKALEMLKGKHEERPGKKHGNIPF